MEVVREGEVLAGKYRVQRVLGQGGMGVVVAAEHLQLGQRVALKFLLPHACSNAEAVARFLREAQAAVQIHSEHVARVSDVGQLDTGAPYMVMEFLQGSDLAALIEQRGALPLTETIDYVLQACEAIAEAHSLGIVHRDLKPANLFLSQRRDGSPLVKVLDFGISKAEQLGANGAPLNLTATSMVMGSPYYMSPEQVRSARDVDARTDIWALGVILHELLTGAPPFRSATASALFAQIVTEEPPPLRQVLPNAPAELEAVLLRCLQKDRERRYANVAELAVALLPFASPGSAVFAERAARMLGVVSVRPSVRATSTRSASPALDTAGAWGQVTAQPEPNRRSLFLGVAVLSLIGAGAFGYWQLKRSAEAPAPAVSATAPVVASELKTAEPTPPPVAPLASEPLEPSVAPLTKPNAAVAKRPGRNASAAAPTPAAVTPVPTPALPAHVVAPSTAAPAAANPPAVPASPPRPRRDLFDDPQ